MSKSMDPVGMLKDTEIIKGMSTMQDKVSSYLANMDKSGFSLDRYLRSTFAGSIERSYGNMLHGFNHRQAIPFVEQDKISQGFVFFTRPQLCLLDSNIQSHALFTNLATENRDSIFRYIRCTLDPRISTPIPKDLSERPVLPPTYFNNSNIFITILTNMIKSLSGWPDPILPVYSSKENMRGGVMRMADGIMQTYGSYDISCTFRNSAGSPVFFLIWYWLNYMSCVYDGTLVPYPDMLAANEIDYNTRIWRIVMDERNQYVKMIGCTGASFPTSTDIGRFFNLNEDNSLSLEHQDLTVTFSCIGACYMTPILLDEFNKAVLIGCPGLTAVRNLRIAGASEEDIDEIVGPYYTKINYDLLTHFNFKGYPFINTETMELEWWIRNTDPYFKTFINNIKKQALDYGITEY